MSPLDYIVLPSSYGVQTRAALALVKQWSYSPREKFGTETVRRSSPLAGALVSGGPKRRVGELGCSKRKETNPCNNSSYIERNGVFFETVVGIVISDCDLGP